MNKRLQNILRQNAEWEKKTPYNFCDRWCERCPQEKQHRCMLYLDEFEQKVTCIAYGKEEDDPEMISQILKKQLEGAEEAIEELTEDDEVGFDDLPEDIQRHVRFVQDNSLDHTARQYCKKAYAFLQDTFYKDQPVKPELKYHLETISWYHTLLDVKLHVALCGFHEPAAEGDLSLCDAVAQFEICKKAVQQSTDALRKIRPDFSTYQRQITDLIALLDNIYSRVELLLASV